MTNGRDLNAELPSGMNPPLDIRHSDIRHSFVIRASSFVIQQGVSLNTLIISPQGLFVTLGRFAAALGAESLVFLTDVPGVLIADRSTVARMTPEQAGEMISSGVVVGGMIPKVEAAIRAARAGCATRIIDGTAAGALAAVLTGLGGGTTITP